MGIDLIGVKNFTSLKLCNCKIWRGFKFSLAACLDKISLIIFEIGQNHQITPKNQIMNNYIKSISILPSNNIYKNSAHTIWKDVCNGPSYLVPEVVSFESSIGKNSTGLLQSIPHISWTVGLFVCSTGLNKDEGKAK